MSRGGVAIVGSGMIGSALAYALTARGHDVVVFEKGPDYPYPHEQPFLETINYDYANPAFRLDDDLRRMTMSGNYRRDLSLESVMVVGGSGTVWSGLAMRMWPRDFKVRSLFGYGDDWPVDYDTLEPWLCRAEAHLGVSGTDDDNPWPRPRSRPYPLPTFPLTEDDALLAERLARDGIRVHTTPQARTRLDYHGRPACMNYGLCDVCPIGARYSPNYHLLAAIATRRCTLHCNVSVRRVLTDAAGRARGLLVRDNHGHADREHPADLVIVAGHAIESARLLLLSKDAKHPDGLGNGGGHVGQHLTFHHVWSGHMHYREPLYPGRVGFWTAQSEQFCDPPTRGRHGGIKIEFSSNPWSNHARKAGEANSVEEALRRFEITRRCRQVAMHAESVPTPQKFVALSRETDRFGDPAAHVHYESGDFDYRTYEFGKQLFARVARATGATDLEYREADDFATFAHHMGTCRMGTGVKDSVTDSFGRVHDTPGLFTIGLGNFVGAGGSVNPTLTAVALALRSADAIAEELDRAG